MREEYKIIEENFDFKPKINKKSERMLAEKSMIHGEENVETSSMGDVSLFQRDRFYELYQDGLKKKMN